MFTLRGGVFPYVLNAGKSISQGAQLTATIKPVSSFTLTGGMTYTDARLEEDLPAAAFDAGSPGYKGDRLPLSSRWSALLSGAYNFPIMPDVGGYVSGTLNYRSRSNSAFDVTDPYGRRAARFHSVRCHGGRDRSQLGCEPFRAEFDQPIGLYRREQLARWIAHRFTQAANLGLRVTREF